MEDIYKNLVSIATGLMIVRESEASAWAMNIWLHGSSKDAPDNWSEVAEQAVLVCDEYLHLKNADIWARRHDASVIRSLHFSYEKWRILEKGFWHDRVLFIVPRPIMDLANIGLTECIYMPFDAYGEVIKELKRFVCEYRLTGLINTYRQLRVDHETAELWAIAVDAHREGLLTFNGARSLAGSWQWGASERVAYPPELQESWGFRRI